MSTKIWGDFHRDPGRVALPHAPWAQAVWMACPLLCHQCLLLGSQVVPVSPGMGGKLEHLEGAVRGSEDRALSPAVC